MVLVHVSCLKMIHHWLPYPQQCLALCFLALLISTCCSGVVWISDGSSRWITVVHSQQARNSSFLSVFHQLSSQMPQEDYLLGNRRFILHDFKKLLPVSGHLTGGLKPSLAWTTIGMPFFNLKLFSTSGLSSPLALHKAWVTNTFISFLLTS